jgi:hypothetical protein
MPIVECTDQDGRPGWTFAPAGTCYAHDGTEEGSKEAKQRAIDQALAVGGGVWPEPKFKSEWASRPVSPLEWDRRYSEDQPRDDIGRWIDAGGPGKTEPAGPPNLEFVEPPEARGLPGGTTGGFTSTGETVTKAGDKYEALAANLGFKSNLPEGVRQGPFDLRWDDSNHVFELKSRFTDSTEYKVGMRKADREKKALFAAQNDLVPHVMIAVIDEESGVARFYWHDELGSKTLSKNTFDQWHYAGTVQWR